MINSTVFRRGLSFMLSIATITAVTLCVFLLSTAKPVFAEHPVYLFDMGTSASPVMSGYTKVTHTTAYSVGGYGWEALPSGSEDRGTGSDDLRRDLIYSDRTKIFRADVENGLYRVRVIMGDYSFSHDDMVLKANGKVISNNIDSAAGQWSDQTFPVYVNEGKLELTFGDGGGSDPNWVVNMIQILPNYFDFGTASSPVQSGYICVTDSTAYSAGGYGWTATPLASFDRTGSSDSLKRDGVNYNSAKVFRVDLPNGDYSVKAVMGDYNYLHDDMCLKANGTVINNNIDSAAGTWSTLTFNVSISGGKLELEFSDLGGADSNWVVNSVEITAASPGYSFDMGTATSPVAAGYSRVTNTTMISTGGFGWIQGVTSATDRASCSDSIKRDFVNDNITYGAKRFKVYLENGIYSVTVTMGDNDYAHDQMGVAVFNREIDRNINTAAGGFAVRTFNACVSNGYLELAFWDQGGTDSNWVLNSVEITWVSPVSYAKATAPAYNSDDVIVYDFKVTADTTGVTDATAAFQEALNYAADMGGGVVYAPPGQYRINGCLTIPVGVILRGEWKSPDSGGLGNGTILKAYAGMGNGSGTPFITMKLSTGLKNISVWYPEQSYSSVYSYPATIYTDAVNINVKNVTLYNSYKGISIGTGSSNTSECLFDNVYATILNTGIYHDDSYDTARYTNLKFGISYWANSGLAGAPSTTGAQDTLKAYTRANAKGIIIDHEDWYYFDSINISDMLVGIEVTKGALLNITRLTTNNVNIGVKLTDCKPAVQIAYSTINAGVGSQPKGIYFGNVNSGDCLLVSNTTFGGTPHTAIYVNGTAGGTISVNNCTFSDWGYDSGTYAIYAKNIGLVVSKSVFSQNKKHIYVASSVMGASITANTFTGGAQIDNYSSNCVINSSALSIPVLPGYTYQFAPEKTPASITRYVNVREAPYFAQGDESTDDTGAIQQALNDVAAAGGGTVYVPAGKYKMLGTLSIPTGVELRGCQDIWHSTVNSPRGTNFYTYNGKGDANGTPFISLNQNSGIRGITIYHPEQNYTSNYQYPWTIRGLGSGCWVKSISLVCAAQGIDMMTYRCDNHIVSEIMGCTLYKGAQVGNGTSGGYLQNVHLAPGLWRYAGYPNQPLDDSMFNWFPDNLVAYKFGAVSNYYNGFNFDISAKTGVQFVSESAGSYSGTLYHFANDGSCCGYQFDQASTVNIIGGQNVNSVGDTARRYLIITGNTFTGTANLYLTTLFGPSGGLAKVNGGTVHMVQMNSSEIVANTFVNTADAGVFELYSSPFQMYSGLIYNNGITSAVVRSCVGRYTITNNAGAKLTADNNAPY